MANLYLLRRKFLLVDLNRDLVLQLIPFVLQLRQFNMYAALQLFDVISLLLLQLFLFLFGELFVGHMVWKSITSLHIVEDRKSVV